MGVDIIEAGFAASSSKDFEAIQEISKNVNKPIITALARLTENDIDKAAESLKYAKKKRIHIFIATSDIHIKDKLRMTKEEVIIKTPQKILKKLTGTYFKITVPKHKPMKANNVSIPR